ncbi:hypothetical protein DFH06DRAFT_995441 [Mycena polygramma]|nr:hypothetical protein DFH06DRAFT_995441 [Mycena polygramma]
MKDIEVESPEKEALFLPSQFSTSERDELRLTVLANVEYTLRKGKAYNALETIRTAIQTLNHNLTVKKAAVHGTGANTRGQNFLKTLMNDIQIAGTPYRYTQAALVKLGLPDDDPVLQPLLREHLRGKDGKAQVAGQSKESDPWIWRAARPSHLSAEQEKEWNTESKCNAIPWSMFPG